jgi:hypothetical protein
MQGLLSLNSVLTFTLFKYSYPIQRSELCALDNYSRLQLLPSISLTSLGTSFYLIADETAGCD